MIPDERAQDFQDKTLPVQLTVYNNGGLMLTQLADEIALGGNQRTLKDLKGTWNLNTRTWMSSRPILVVRL